MGRMRSSYGAKENCHLLTSLLMKMPGYQKKQDAHLDYPKSLKSIRMIVRSIWF